jgi:hypothetical protein
MIDLFDLYNSFIAYVNTGTFGWFRPQTDFTEACNSISKELWVKWTREAEKSQEAKDFLMPFLRSKNIIVSTNGPYGKFSPPKNYGRYASARIIVSGDTCWPDKSVDGGKCEQGEFKSQEELTDEYFDSINQVDVELIDDQKWGAVNSHLTKKPTLSKPKIRQIDNGFEVAPRKVSVVVLDYYVEPKEATFVYTISPGNVQTGAGDQIIYDQKNSIPLEWPSTIRNEFLERLKIWYSRFTRDNTLAQIDLQQKQLMIS